MPNIYTANNRTYQSTSSGIKVYNPKTGELNYFIAHEGGVTSVWADSENVYAGTNNGVYRTSAFTTDPLTLYKGFPDITSNEVKYVHGSGDYICIATVSGVDRLSKSSGERKAVVVSDVTKCFQAASGDFYYITNDYVPVENIDMSLYDWEYYKTVTLSYTVGQEYILGVEIPITAGDSIYNLSYNNGADIRVIDNLGRLLFNYRELWDSVNTPTLCVKVLQGTNSFRVYFGNRNARDLQSVENTSDFFDDFSGTVLDTTKWTFSDSGYSTNKIVIGNGYAQLQNYHPSCPTSITTKTTFSGAVVDCLFSKYVHNQSYPNGIKYSVIFNNGPTSYVGADSSKGAHTLVTNTVSGTITGTKYISSGYGSYIVENSLSRKKSYYNFESLSALGSFSVNSGTIKFELNGSSYTPHLNIDRIRIRKKIPNEPTYMISPVKKVTESNQYGRLHCIYEDSTFTYTPGKESMLKSTYINDIHVVEKTSPEKNIILLGTDWGGYLIEENREDLKSSDYKLYLIET